MQYRRLGHTGFRVSAIGLGTNSFGSRADETATAEVLAQAVDLGVTLIDTANVYSGSRSETLIGRALTGPLKARRHDLVLATKAAMAVGDGPNDRGASRHHLMRELEKSLARLGTDYLDLYWVHTWDPETPLEETLSALDEMVRQGKVRYVGCSNYRAWEAMKALHVSAVHHWVPFQAVQLSYSLADRTAEREALPMVEDQGMGFVAYFPLAGGILTGKYLDGQVPEGSRAATVPRFRARLTEAYQELAREVRSVADELGALPGQVALAWLLANPSVTSAIAGATQGAQLTQNVAAADLVLPAAALERLNALSDPFRWSAPFGDARPLVHP